MRGGSLQSGIYGRGGCLRSVVVMGVQMIRWDVPEGGEGMVRAPPSPAPPLTPPQGRPPWSAAVAGSRRPPPAPPQPRPRAPEALPGEAGGEPGPLSPMGMGRADPPDVPCRVPPQEDNGLPVHLKGGAMDSALYHFTTLVCSVGTAWGGQQGPWGGERTAGSPGGGRGIGRLGSIFSRGGGGAMSAGTPGSGGRGGGVAKGDQEVGHLSTFGGGGGRGGPDTWILWGGERVPELPPSPPLQVPATRCGHWLRLRGPRRIEGGPGHPPPPPPK